MSNPLVPFNNSGTISIGDNHLTLTNEISSTGGGCGIWGMTSDNDGNVYVVESCADASSRIIKYNSNGNVTAISPIDSRAQVGGYATSLGIRYHSKTNKIYTSTWYGTEDCIASFSTDLVYLGAAVPPNGNSAPFDNPGYGKAFNIITECCPLPATVVIDTVICNASFGDKINLRSLLSCSEGIICEGNWTPNPSNQGFVYNDCDQSVTINSSEACGEFKLESTGGNGSLCGPFEITLKISSETLNDVTIIGDQSVCGTGTFSQLTSSGGTSTTGNVIYQWQSSTVGCTVESSFSDISGANLNSYTPVGLTQTTYFRLKNSVAADCATGNCSNTSNCITVNYTPCCSPNCGTVTVIKN